MKKLFGALALVAVAIAASMFMNTDHAGEADALATKELVIRSAQVTDAGTKPETVEPKSYNEMTVAIVDVLAKKETGGSEGCIDRQGQSGEIGCFQFMPSTWAGYSKQVFGEVVEMTPENERAVVLAKVSGWLNKGMTPEQIFLAWQQGDYSQCRSGINSHGVKFDSCDYVSDAMAKLNVLLGKN